MRIGFVLALAIAMGLAVGVGASVAEFGYDYNDQRPSLTTFAVPLSDIPPKLILKEPIYEFGEMENIDVGRHKFVLENDGPGTLKLGVGTPSCSCTIANITRQEIPCGESAEVTVEWKPLHFFGELTKTVTFPTNDPNHRSLVLTVHGTVLTAWRIDPTNISFHGMSSRETAERTANLLVYKGDKCEILGYEWGEKKTAEHFGLVYDELTPGELAKLKPIPKSGYKLTFVARKGMPTGPLVQTVAIKTTLDKKTPITVPIYGHVTSDITIIGPREFNQQMNLLYMGNIPQGTEKQFDMSMLLVGEHRNEIKFTVAKVVPEELQVTLGEPKAGYGGNSSMVPIKITLPPTAKPQAWLSSKPEEMGQIVITTTHPDYKELKILLRVAVVEPTAPNAPPKK